MRGGGGLEIARAELLFLDLTLDGLALALETLGVAPGFGKFPIGIVAAAIDQEFLVAGKVLLLVQRLGSILTAVGLALHFGSTRQTRLPVRLLGGVRRRVRQTADSRRQANAQQQVAERERQ